MFKQQPKEPVKVPETLVKQVVDAVEERLPSKRGEQVTEVLAFPLTNTQLSKDFLDAFVKIPEIMTLMNKLMDLDMMAEFYIQPDKWELRLKFSYREFPGHKIGFKYGRIRDEYKTGFIQAIKTSLFNK